MIRNEMIVEVLIYDAFTEIPGKGNPAGVVLTGNKLTDNQMQNIAKELNFNETAFVVQDVNGNLCIRYFTPGHEVPMCGHATIAAMYALNEMGQKKGGFTKIQTLSGILEVEVIIDGHIKIGMQQTAFKELEYRGEIDSLAHVIGLKGHMIDDRYPIRYVNTGLWTLLVPIKRLSYFKDMCPHTEEFPKVLKELNRSSIHPFCIETYNEECQMHGRHFSSPYSGTIEDAVTGTASGAMGAYYQKYICSSKENRIIKVEQGNEIGRDGMVEIEIPKDLSKPVKIYGTAVFSGKRNIIVEV